MDMGKMKIATDQLIAEMQIPEIIAKLIEGHSFFSDDVGMSDSSVLMFDEMVLKIQADTEESANEAHMMEWLKGTLPVPELLGHAVVKQKSFILMSRLRGEMLCTPGFMADPEKLVELAAQGLTDLQSIPIESCPYRTSLLQSRLQSARYIVSHGLVDVENTEPETWKQFGSPESLLQWLLEHQP